MSTDPYGSPPPEPNYAQPNYSGEPNYPGGRPPELQEAASKKLAAGLCGILLGSFGVHKFILGYNNAGIIMAAVTVASLVGGIATCGLLTPLSLPLMGVMSVIGLAEGIVYLTKSDEEFYHVYMVGKKEWF